MADDVFNVYIREAAQMTYSGIPSPSTAGLPARDPASVLDRNSGAPGSRRFFQAPQSVSGYLAAVLDAAVIVLTLLALHLTHHEPFGRWAIALSLMIIALAYPGRTRLDHTPWQMAADIASNWFGLLALLLLCVYVTRSAGDLNWRLVEQWVVLTPLVHWLAALGLRAGTRWYARRDRSVRPVVIVGAGELGRRTAQALERLDGPRRRVVGYFDDRRDDRISGEARERHLGRLDEAARYVDKLGIRDVYITLPVASQPRFVGLLDALQGTTASLYVVPDVFSTHIVQGRLQDLGGLPVVGICESPFTGTNALAKRACDLLLASVVLLALLPLMLSIAAAIRLNTPGPALVRQRRNGLDGEEIIVLKFRTLHLESGQPRPGLDNPGAGQVTRVGHWLRRLSLDALPQLLNVLQGRMSIVGPRPHAIADNALYRHRIRGYMVRHKARPGITGWAQVHGQRGDGDELESMQRRLAYDLEYLRNWSIGLDLQIMLRAVRGAVSRGLRAV